ncbi:hypothetical protein [Methanococcoides seepicolus]|uniref:Uncharacterized protein n=1 Tax=Methanococcoides seepicolus TaxID=2828780 RepID=A0A9E4ZE94_9EURY|nr:hypothetical protein [Methanococcoides seepicolus]MCM1986283.1 hypothetical protein [Methanococcoides seepicolus]
MIGYLLEHYINPIIVLFIVSIAFSAGTDTTNGVLFSYLEKVPSIYYMLIIAFGILWIVGIFIYKRRQTQKKGIGLIPTGHPIHGWKILGNIEYKDVLWTMRIPNRTPWSIGKEPLDLDDIDIKIPPICPKCNTELNQKDNVFGLYNWNCPHPKCSYKKRWNFSSWYSERETVKKIAKTDIRSNSKKRRI